MKIQGSTKKKKPPFISSGKRNLPNKNVSTDPDENKSTILEPDYTKIS